MGFGEQLNYFGDLGEHKQNTFREKLTGIWGDQSIIFRELGSKDPPPPWRASNMFSTLMIDLTFDS